jgi:hypothetical protein
MTEDYYAALADAGVVDNPLVKADAFQPTMPP